MGTFAAYRDNGKTNEEGLFKWLYRLFTGGVDSVNRPTSLKVSQKNSGANMSIDVGIGDISINLAEYTLWGWSTAIENRTVIAADPTNPRRDLVVAYIDLAVTDVVTSNNPGGLKFIVVAGTPAASPADPSGATIQAAVGPGNPYKILGRIALPANATQVVDAYITDLRQPLALKARLWGGSSNTSGHIVPDAADDTVVLQNATQTLNNKTLTGSTVDNPEIKNWDGWQDISTTLSVASGYNNGQNEHVLDSSTDLTGLISPGAKLRISRNTAPTTQCADFEASSSQYATLASPSGLAFTDDFTVEFWVKLESYGSGVIQTVLSRFDGTSGFFVGIPQEGQVVIKGFNGSGSNVRQASTLISLPLDEWVHVCASLDMSSFTPATCPIYINGISVPVVVNQGGTNPTSIINTGPLQIGNYNSSTNVLDGKLSEVRLWNGFRTALQIRDNMYQPLASPSGITALHGYWPLAGNWNDLSSKGNNLAAVNGAIPNAADHRWKQIEYAKVTAVTSTQLKVFTGKKHSIPNMQLNNPAFSIEATPFGFPAERSTWCVDYIANVGYNRGVSGNASFDMNFPISVPTGKWLGSAKGKLYCDYGSSTNFSLLAIISPVFADADLQKPFSYSASQGAFTNSMNAGFSIPPTPVETTVLTPYYFSIFNRVGINLLNLVLDNATTPLVVRFELAYN